MLCLVTLAAALVVVGLAVAVWQLRRSIESSPPTPVTSEHTAAPPPSAAEDVELFMGEESRRELTAGVVAVIGVGSQGVLAGLALIQADPASLFWATEEADKVPKLRPDLLAHVRDGERVGSWWTNEDEAAAYCDALIKASRTSAEAFARSARRDLTYVNVFEEPRRFRGDVIHVRGRLRMLTRYDPPLMAAQAGVRDLYEGWVFDERYPANPWCILLTELPAGITPGDRVDYDVAFEGYFFKRYRYKSVDSVKANQFRDAPLLIGRTLRLRQPVAVTAAADNWSGYLLPAFLAVLALSAALTAGLTWWFRREDRKVQQRVLGLRDREFVEPP